MHRNLSTRVKMRLGRAIPNAGYEARYRREMVRIIKSMHSDVLKEVGGFYSIELASDAKITFTKLMAMLRKKWYKVFEQRAKQMARWLVETVGKRTKDNIMNQLKKIGFIVNPQYDVSEKEIMKDMISKNVKLIKSIPQKYLRAVQDVVNEAWERGGDVEYIVKNIKNMVSKKYKNAERRAELIARDQLNKITQQWAFHEAKACGATRGCWIHVPGEYTSRITHIHMNKKDFDLNTGLYDEDVKRCVKPSELPFCQCQCQFIFGEN